MRWNSLAWALVLAWTTSAAAADAGNRLTYLDEPANPYYPARDTARLITPQWVGEEGVEAVIVLAIDDMTEPAKYEAFLRPILNRLKAIDGRAGMSIMTKYVQPPDDPQLATWLAEGVSLETHTYDHPCPCLEGSNLAKAKDTYDRGIAALAAVPENRPVAFRMPCCDSMNSVSPRFFTEIFNRTTPSGDFLTVDSSVFHVFTAADPELPRDLVLDADGQPRLGKYLPLDRSMANYIEDYPYPYVIGRLCWEIPSIMPSDWDAQHRNGKCSPQTLADLQAALDALVRKRGTAAICFHPHGWISAEQMVALVDYAVTRHGKQVKFLSFRDVEERLNRNLLGGHPLRAPDGRDNGVRVLDVNADGFMDAVVGNAQVRQTRVWSPKGWTTCPFPAPIVVDNAPGRDGGVRFGTLDTGATCVLVRNERQSGLWGFRPNTWTEIPGGLAGLAPDILTSRAGRDQGVRLRDLDGDGGGELLLANPAKSACYTWAVCPRRWQPLPFALPEGTAFVDGEGRDAGLRLVDIDADGRAEAIFSNAERYSLHRFTSPQQGWSHKIAAARRGETDAAQEIPMIVRADGTNNGAWFNHGHMWVQNEDTGKALPDHVDRRSYAALLRLGQDPTRRAAVDSTRGMISRHAATDRLR